MKKQLVASVLLASMAFTVPVYAIDDRTPDEYNPNAKYESPLDQPREPIVNDYRKAQTTDESNAFAQTAGRMVQGSASGKRVSSGENTSQNATAVSKEKNDPVIGNEKKLENDKVEDAEQNALGKAEQKAEEVLSKTDENFEPVQETKLPGDEYQAFRQNRSVKNADTPNTSQPQNPVAAAVVTPATATATPEEKENKKPSALPVTIKGNDAQYSSETGDFIIEGNVTLEQGVTKMYSTKAVGNEKTGDIWLLEGGTLQEPTNTVHARWVHYNYNKETGELLHIKGASQAKAESTKYDYYEAPHGLIENGRMVIDQGGMTTRCPAVRHSSCLAVKAKTITIIPNDRIIARGVKVFVKGKHVYSRDVWVSYLQKKTNPMSPHIGWDNDKGWIFSIVYNSSIGNPLLKNPTTFYMKQAYYTKSKYKPFYGIRHDQQDFYVRLHHGYIYDSDNDRIDEGIWLQKKMDWGLFLKPHRIAKGLPLTVDGYITHGSWKYSHQNWSSRHTEANIRLMHDRFYPLGGNKLYLDLMVGRRWVNESLDNWATQRYGKNLSTNVYQGTLGYVFSNKWNIWTTYHHEHRTSYLFSLSQPSFTRDWRLGVSWKPDQWNTFTVVNRRNLDSNTSTHGNYTTTFIWSHRFCCEVLNVEYQKKHYNGKNQWTVRFDFLNW